MKKLCVDKSSCIGCGFCFSSFPDLFESDENGLSQVKVETIEEDNQDAIAASEGCPTGAISIKEEENAN